MSSYWVGLRVGFWVTVRSGGFVNAIDLFSAVPWSRVC